MDILVSLFFRLIIFTIGFLFLFIIIVRSIGAAIIPFLRWLEELSGRRAFQRIFFIIGILLFIIVSVFVLPSQPVIAVLCGLVGGIIYLLMLYSLMILLHNYLNEDE